MSTSFNWSLINHCNEYNSEVQVSYYLLYIWSISSQLLTYFKQTLVTSDYHISSNILFGMQKR